MLNKNLIFSDSFTNRLACAGLIMGLATTPAFAGPPWNTDDPETTPGRFLGFEVGWVQISERGSRFTFAPDLTVTYGLFDNLEIGVNLAQIRLSEAGVGQLSGIGDPTFGLKYRFFESDQETRLAVLYEVTAATAREGLRGAGAEHALSFIGGQAINGWDFIGQLGIRTSADREDGQAQIFGGLLAVYEVTPGQIVGFELFGNTTPVRGEPAEFSWAVGAQREINEVLPLEASYSRAFNASRDQFYVGFTWFVPVARVGGGG